MVKDFADAPLFWRGSLPELGVGQSIQRTKSSLTLRVEQVKVVENDCGHEVFPL
jgi:hypothetical protein